MRPPTVPPELIASWNRTDRPWWEAAAAECVSVGRSRLFSTREGSDPYLLRMWLSPPKVAESGEWDAASSLLLHYFFRGDDDQALHDHPWWFRTRILCGGYDEHLPPAYWPIGSELGPAWDELIRHVDAPQTVEHRARDLHCVGTIRPGTFTLVETGPTERDEWGFHPPGEQWISSAKYLRVRS